MRSRGTETSWWSCSASGTRAYDKWRLVQEKRFVLDWLLGEQIGLTWFAQYPAGLDLTRRKDEKAEAAYQDLIFRHYQFYQFYVNQALPVLSVLRESAVRVGAGVRRLVRHG